MLTLLHVHGVMTASWHHNHAHIAHVCHALMERLMMQTGRAARGWREVCSAWCRWVESVVMLVLFIVCGKTPLTPALDECDNAVAVLSGQLAAAASEKVRCVCVCVMLTPAAITMRVCDVDVAVALVSHARHAWPAKWTRCAPL